MSAALTVFTVIALPPAAGGDDALLKIVGFLVLGVVVLIFKAVQAVRDAVRTQQQKGQRPGPPQRKPMGPQMPTPPWQQGPAPQRAPQQRLRKGGRSRQVADVAVAPRLVPEPAPKRPPPLPAVPPPAQRGTSFAARLVRPQNLRAAVLLSEILKPPVSLQEERPGGVPD